MIVLRELVKNMTIIEESIRGGGSGVGGGTPDARDTL